MEFKVDTSDIEKTAKLLGEAPGAMRAQVPTVFASLGEQFISLMKDSLRRESTSGHLTESIKVLEQEESSITIGPDAPHTMHVRIGGQPHSPPRLPIAVWVGQKGLRPNNPNETLDDLIKRVMWSIRNYGTSRWSQVEYGTMGNPFPTRTLEFPDAQTALRKAGLDLASAITAKVTE